MMCSNSSLTIRKMKSLGSKNYRCFLTFLIEITGSKIRLFSIFLGVNFSRASLIKIKTFEMKIMLDQWLPAILRSYKTKFYS